MLIKYDKAADAKYVGIHKRKVASTMQIKPWLVMDLDVQKQVVGIEILDASKHPIMITSDEKGVHVVDVIESQTPASGERAAIQEFITTPQKVYG